MKTNPHVNNYGTAIETTPTDDSTLFLTNIVLLWLWTSVHLSVCTCASTNSAVVDAHVHHSEDTDSRNQSVCSGQDGPVRDLQQRTASHQDEKLWPATWWFHTVSCTHPDLQRARRDLQKSFHCTGHYLISEYLETTNVWIHNIRWMKKL